VKSVALLVAVSGRVFLACVLLSLPGGCHKEPPPAPAGPSAEDLARQAALASFQLSPSDGARIDLELTGDESAAIAREKQGGVCAVLYVAPNGTWQEFSKVKGTVSEAQLAAPLRSAGTAQEGATRNDLTVLVGRMCK
jgi:hypothetical protein